MKIYFDLGNDEQEITPIKVAEAIINNGSELTNSDFVKAITGEEKRFVSTFDICDLKEISAHLLAFCASAEAKQKLQ